MKKKVTNLKQTQAWKNFSKYIRLRGSVDEYNVCYTCGNSYHYKEMNAGHYIHSKKNTFFDEMNVQCQCVRCNMYLSGNLGVYCERLTHEHSVEAVDELRLRSNMKRTFDKDDLKAIAKEYREKVEAMEL